VHGDVCVAAETAQWPRKVYRFPCIAVKESKCTQGQPNIMGTLSWSEKILA